MIKIDKGIPIPRGGKSNQKHPFADMEAGDSVLCQCKYDPLSIAKRNTAHLGFKFISRSVDGGFRIWRVE